MASRSLLDLVRDGTLPVGTELYHRRLQYPNDRSIAAVVVAGGIEFGGAVYVSPSGAARAAAGHAENGWRYWRLRSSDQRLDDLDAED
jgi:hypothetical protein